MWTTRCLLHHRAGGCGCPRVAYTPIITGWHLHSRALACTGGLASHGEWNQRRHRHRHHLVHTVKRQVGWLTLHSTRAVLILHARSHTGRARARLVQGAKPTMEDKHCCGVDIMLGGTSSADAGASADAAATGGGASQTGTAWRYHAVFDGHDGDAAVRALPFVCARRRASRARGTSSRVWCCLPPDRPCSRPLTCTGS